MPSGENTDGSLNFMPAMGRENLLASYRKILKTIYSPNCDYQRINTFIANYRPTGRARVSLENLAAFCRSV